MAGPEQTANPAKLKPAAGNRDVSYEVDRHYDLVTEAWGLLLGDELHYGVFESPQQDLASATRRLTDLMAEALQIGGPLRVLDAGCGTGTTACYLALQTGANVVGITTSMVGVESATDRARSMKIDDLVSFEQRDATDTGLPGSSFDRVWVLEASHLMRDKSALIGECARVLQPGGRFALCDIVLRRELSLPEIKERRLALTVLREVFGDAHMVPLDHYAEWARFSGMTADIQRDLTTETRPTFGRWRANAEQHEARVVESVGQEYWEKFVESTQILERFWDDGTLGYGLIAGVKPGR